MQLKSIRPLSLVALACLSASASSNSLSSFLADGEVYGGFNLRYEGVDQDNALQDASALTLRTNLGYKTKETNGFSMVVEFEDNRIVLGQSDFSVPPTGFKPGEFSVIADPETTELDQAFVQYRTDDVTVKLGRQVITHDGHRFIGSVAWRQDHQTFDAARVIYSPNDKFKAEYTHLMQRNRIFAQAQDLDSNDHLVHLSYQTDLGKLVGYSYLLEVDNDIDNSLDTYGFSFKGSKAIDKSKLLYHAEFATQSNSTPGAEFDTEYLFLEGGAVVSGITFKLAYEVLGSDNGQGAFQMPLATLHKFNGWSDQFLNTPAQGLVDTYFTVSGKALGGTWLAVYHDFSADEASDTLDDFGSELNLQFVKPINKKTKVALKYASYSSDDFKVDTDKLWAWVSVAF